MDTTPQLFFQVARQIAQPDVMRMFSALLGAALASPKVDPSAPAPIPVLPAHPPPHNEAAIALLASWMAEDAAMTFDEQHTALAEWDQLQHLLDAEYLADNPLQP